MEIADVSEEDTISIFSVEEWPNRTNEKNVDQRESELTNW
jgi:hypothetical protein